jgi:hypothetical protein
MGGVYGDMLSAFTELLEDYEVFSMDAKLGAGYAQRTNRRTVTGYLSRIKGGAEGIEGGLRTENQYGIFYEKLSGDESVIRQGDYLERKHEIYQFIHDDDFEREGGFVSWDVQLLAAFTDQQRRDPNVDLAADFR